MLAPPVLRDVFHAHHATWGEEDDGHTFEQGPGPVGRVDVLVYRPTHSVDMTSFTTVGMAFEEMPVSGGRAELQFGRRGRLDPREEAAIAVQLANLAIYPWATGAPLGWGEMVGLGHDFPTFPGCDAVFLAGPLTSTGRDYIDTGEGKVRLINVVPITHAERVQARTMPPMDFLRQLMKETNVFMSR